MSSTRHARPNAPLSQERYLSSPEFAELRGLSGTAVAAKAALLQHPAKRSLLWFLQALSLQDGGLRKVARELLAMFPERLGTPTMHRLGIEAGKVYSGKEPHAILWEMDHGGEIEQVFEDMHFTGSKRKPLELSVEALLKECREVALSRPDSTEPKGRFNRSKSPRGLMAFLVEICINPRVLIPPPSGRDETAESDAEKAREEFLELCDSSFLPASVPYFSDIVGALYEYQRRHQEKERADFVLTEIGRKVWDTFDFALKTRRMVLVDGLEGRGKSEAAKAWCRLHLGEARFISLKGITGKTNLFRTISQALGVGCGLGKSALEMQNRIEDVLHRSGLALIIDEAHYLFDPKPRMYARPELVDWVDTALCNHGVPVGLVSTPQLLQSVRQAGAQTGWNHRQFRRRVKRYAQLPEWNTDADLASVARKLLPGIAREGIKLAVGYAKLNKRDVSGLGDVAEEARLLAREAGRTTVIFEDVSRAINEQLMPSDAAFEKALNPPANRAGRQNRSTGAEALQGSSSATAALQSSDPGCNEMAPESEGFPARDTQPAVFDRRSAGARVVTGSHRQTTPALVPA